MPLDVGCGKSEISVPMTTPPRQNQIAEEGETTFTATRRVDLTDEKALPSKANDFIRQNSFHWNFRVDPKTKLIKENFKSPCYGVLIRKVQLLLNPFNDIFLHGEISSGEKEPFLLVHVSSPQRPIGCNSANNEFKYAFFVSETTNEEEIANGAAKCFCSEFITPEPNKVYFEHKAEQMPLKLVRGKHHFLAPLTAPAVVNTQQDSKAFLQCNCGDKNQTYNLQVFVDSAPVGLGRRLPWKLCLMTDREVVEGHKLYSNDNFSLIGFQLATAEISTNSKQYFYFASSGDYQTAEVNETEDNYRSLGQVSLTDFRFDGIVAWSKSVPQNYSKAQSSRKYPSNGSSLLAKNSIMALGFRYYCEMTIHELLGQSSSKTDEISKQIHKLQLLASSSNSNGMIKSQTGKEDEGKEVGLIVNTLTEVMKATQAARDKYYAAFFIFLFMNNGLNLTLISTEDIRNFILGCSFASLEDAKRFKEFVQRDIPQNYVVQLSSVCQLLLHNHFKSESDAPLILQWLIVCIKKKEEWYRLPIELSIAVLTHYPTKVFTTNSTKLLTLHYVKHWQHSNVLSLNLSVAEYINAIARKLEKGLDTLKPSLINPLTDSLALLTIQNSSDPDSMSKLQSELENLVHILSERNPNDPTEQETVVTLLYFVLKTVNILQSTVSTRFDKEFKLTVTREIDKAFEEESDRYTREIALLFAAKLVSLELRKSNLESAQWCDKFQQETRRLIVAKINEHSGMKDTFVKAKSRYPGEHWQILNDIFPHSTKTAQTCTNNQVPSRNGYDQPSENYVAVLSKEMPILHSVTELPKLLAWKNFSQLYHFFITSGGHLFRKESLDRLMSNLNVIESVAESIVQYSITERLIRQIIPHWDIFYSIYKKRVPDGNRHSRLAQAYSKCKQALQIIDSMHQQTLKIESILRAVQPYTTISEIPLTGEDMDDLSDYDIGECFDFETPIPTFTYSHSIANPKSVDAYMKLKESALFINKLSARLQQEPSITFNHLMSKVIPECETAFNSQCRELLHGKITFRSARQTFEKVPPENISKELQFIEKHCDEELSERSTFFASTLSPRYRNLENFINAPKLNQEMCKLLMSLGVEHENVDPVRSLFYIPWRTEICSKNDKMIKC